MRDTAIALARSDSDGVNTTINTALRVYVTLGAVVLASTIAMTAFAPLVMGDTASTGTVQVVLFIVGFDLALTFPTKAVAGIVQAKLRYDLLLILDLSTFALASGATVVAMLQGFDVISLAVIALVTGQLHNVLYLLLTKRLFPPLSFNWHGFDPSRVRAMASYSGWSFMIQVANQMRFRVDSLVVGALLGGEAITRYAVGARLVEYAQSPIVLVSNTALPALTRMHASGDHDRLPGVVLFLLRVNLLISIFAAGLVIFLGGPFIVRWMGPNHSASHQIASVLVVGFMTEVFLLPLTNWLLAAAKHRMLAIANASEAVVNLVLSIVLGRTWGLMGVAVGTVVPLLLVQLCWVAPYACRALGIGISQFFRLSVPALVAVCTFAVISSFLGSVVRSNGYLGVLSAAAVLTAAYWPVVVMVCLNSEDRGRLWDALPLPVRG